ncbi:MAG: hypothetical protein SFU55_07090 [Methylophilus sp.]|nr:hypothetical protein [Methylophilus sp.]
MSLNFEKKIDTRLIAILSFFFFLFNYWVHFPGEMTPDSNNQYAEALSHSFTDLHPPMMAFLWSFLIRFADAAPAMLAFHLVFHWLGLYCIAAGLVKVEKKWAALLVLVAGFFPVLFFHNGFLHKDIGMASTFITAFGLIFYFKIQEKKVPILILLASVLLLVYGTLVRANGIFALGPLVIYMYLNTHWQKKITVVLVCSVLVSVVALPLTQVFNKQVIGARMLQSTYPLFLFDIVGIAKHSNDLQVLPESVRFSKEDLDKCYTPFWWDPLSPWGECKQKTQRFGKESKVSAEELNKRGELKDVWVKAIALYPLAYLEHRLKVFNSELYFLVPAYHCHYAVGCGVGQNIAHNIKLDYLKNNFLFWPVFWLVLGLVLIALQSKASLNAQSIAARMLILSGVLYLLALSIIGIATVNRYAYWSILVILLGAILAYPQLEQAAYKNKKWLLAGTVFLVLTVVAGLLSRVFDFTYLVI